MTEETMGKENGDDTSETSTPRLEDKISVLSFLPQVKHDWAVEFCSRWDMSIPLAVGVQLEWIVELSDKGVENIEDCFASLCELFRYDSEQELIDYILTEPDD